MLSFQSTIKPYILFADFMQGPRNNIKDLETPSNVRNTLQDRINPSTWILNMKLNLM